MTVIRTIIIKDLIIPVSKKEAVFIDFSLNKIKFFCKNGKCTVNIMQFIRGWFQKLFDVNGLKEKIASCEKFLFLSNLRNNNNDRERRRAIVKK